MLFFTTEREQTLEGLGGLRNHRSRLCSCPYHPHSSFLSLCLPHPQRFVASIIRHLYLLMNIQAVGREWRELDLSLQYEDVPGGEDRGSQLEGGGVNATLGLWVGGSCSAATPPLTEIHSCEMVI